MSIRGNNIGYWPLYCYCYNSCSSSASVCVSVIATYLHWIDYLGLKRSGDEKFYFHDIKIGIVSSHFSRGLRCISSKVIYSSKDQKFYYILRKISYDIELEHCNLFTV